VLIYLGTGVAILPLIAVLVFIVLDLWAPALIFSFYLGRKVKKEGIHQSG